MKNTTLYHGLFCATLGMNCEMQRIDRSRVCRFMDLNIHGFQVEPEHEKKVFSVRA